MSIEALDLRRRRHAGRHRGGASRRLQPRVRAAAAWAGRWTRTEYRDLLSVTGGKERIAAYIESLPLSTATAAAPDRARAARSMPTKTRLYSAAVRDGSVPLRDGVARLLDEALDAGCRLAIASTTTAVNIDALLQARFGARGLEMFDVIACGDQVRAQEAGARHLPARAAARWACGPNGPSRSRIRPTACALRVGRGPVDRRHARPSGPRAATSPQPALVLPHLGDPSHPLPARARYRVEDARRG